MKHKLLVMLLISFLMCGLYACKNSGDSAPEEETVTDNFNDEDESADTDDFDTVYSVDELIAMMKSETITEDDLYMMLEDGTIDEDILEEVLSTAEEKDLENTDSSGIVAVKINMGSNYNYNSTGTFKFTSFTVTLDVIDPETGEISNLKTFSSEETHSCSAGFYYISGNTTVTSRYFSSDLTKMIATLTLEDGSLHIGWVDEYGGFTDVTDKISVSSGFGGLIKQTDPCFWKDYLYFKDSTNENIQIKRVPLDNLTPDAVEILFDDVHWAGSLYPYADGSIDDNIFASHEYYDESMTYVADTNFFNDWISESECVGTDEDMIYKYNLENVNLAKGEAHRSDEWYSEATPLIPEIKGRENWNAVVSPECDKVAFLSKLASSTDPETMLYIVPVEGGEPVKVNTAYDFTNLSDIYQWVGLMDWK